MCRVSGRLYLRGRSNLHQPRRVRDCSAKLACRVEAIYWEGDSPDEHQHLGDNAAFSPPSPATEWLRQVRRVAPRGGPDRVDTPLVAAGPGGVPLSRRRRAHNTQRNKETAAGRPSRRSMTHHVRHWSPAAPTSRCAWHRSRCTRPRHSTSPGSAFHFLRSSALRPLDSQAQLVAAVHKRKLMVQVLPGYVGPTLAGRRAVPTGIATLQRFDALPAMAAR